MTRTQTQAERQDAKVTRHGKPDGMARVKKTEFVVVVAKDYVPWLREGETCYTKAASTQTGTSSRGGSIVLIHARHRQSRYPRDLSCFVEAVVASHCAHPMPCFAGMNICAKWWAPHSWKATRSADAVRSSGMAWYHDRSEQLADRRYQASALPLLS